MWSYTLHCPPWSKLNVTGDPWRHRLNQISTQTARAGFVWIAAERQRSPTHPCSSSVSAAHLRPVSFSKPSWRPAAPYESSPQAKRPLVSTRLRRDSRRDSDETQTRLAENCVSSKTLPPLRTLPFYSRAACCYLKSFRIIEYLLSRRLSRKR